MRVTFVLALGLLSGGCVSSDDAQPTDGAPAAEAAPPSTLPTTPATSAPASSPVPAPAPRASGTRRYEQDDAGDASLALPPAIVRALETDELVLTCRDGTDDGTSRFKAAWVGVRRIDLNADGREDWIVNGRHRCLRTTYAAYWWAYEHTATGPRMVMRAEPAAALDVLTSSTHGFRDLRMRVVNGRGAALVADTQYDGKSYVAAPAP